MSAKTYASLLALFKAKMVLIRHCPSFGTGSESLQLIIKCNGRGKNLKDLQALMFFLERSEFTQI